MKVIFLMLTILASSSVFSAKKKPLLKLTAKNPNTGIQSELVFEKTKKGCKLTYVDDDGRMSKKNIECSEVYSNIESIRKASKEDAFALDVDSSPMYFAIINADEKEEFYNGMSAGVDPISKELASVFYVWTL